MDDVKEELRNSRPKSTLVTLPLSAWSNNTQTVTVPGVLADESKQLIQPMPTIADQAVYSAAGISCTGQPANKLTFKAQTVPTEDVQVYVVILPSRFRNCLSLLFRMGQAPLCMGLISLKKAWIFRTGSYLHIISMGLNLLIP